MSLGHSAVSPTEILLISEGQYSNRDDWNERNPGFNELPPPWRSEQPIDWMDTTPDLSSTSAWLPAGLCLLGHAMDRKAGLPPADSNGLAAGSTKEDAAVRAFSELVERDAVAIWWYNRVVRPHLDLADLGDSLVSEYASWSAERGRPLRLFDLTHDFGIVVVAAVACGADGRAPALGFGVGTSTAPAARHAVGELAQFEGNVGLIQDRVAAAGEIGLTPEAKALLRWWRNANIAEHPHLVGDKTLAAACSGPPLDLRQCHEACRRRGLRFLALDLTRQDIDLPVVRVVVPGLRPMWARFASGRLYDVPVQQGWISRRLESGELNPTPLMF